MEVNSGRKQKWRGKDTRDSWFHQAGRSAVLGRCYSSSTWCWGLRGRGSPLHGLGLAVAAGEPYSPGSVEPPWGVCGLSDPAGHSPLFYRSIIKSTQQLHKCLCKSYMLLRYRRVDGGRRRSIRFYRLIYSAERRGLLHRFIPLTSDPEWV